MDWVRIKINSSCKKILQGTVQTSLEGISRRSSCGAGKEMFKNKVCCTYRVVVLLTKPIAFLPFPLQCVAVAFVVAKTDVVGDNKRQLNEGNEALHRKGYH